MFRIAVCDDDIEIFHQVKSLLGHLDVQEIVDRDIILTKDDYYSDGTSFIQEIQNKEYDVVFMDIELGNEMGMDIIQRMRDITYKTKVIFISNHTDYFRELAEIGLFSFILKPIKILDFKNVMLKLFNAIDDDSDMFMFNHKSIKVKMPVNEIIIIEKSGRRTLVVTKDKTYEISSTLKSALKKLNSQWFISASTSYAVNYKHISCFHKDHIVLSTGKEVTIPERRRKEVRQEYLKMRKYTCCI